MFLLNNSQSIEIFPVLLQNDDIVSSIDGNNCFSFSCKCCGVCCSAGLDIFINSMDIWNLRNYYQKPTGYIIEKYLVIERRAEYGSYPLCLIRHGNDGCPFLEGNLCGIHQSRPAGCRLFPVTQYYLGDGKPMFELAPDRDFCPGETGAMQTTLDRWLADNSFGMYDKVIRLQHRLSGLLKVRLDDNGMRELFGIIFDFDSCSGFPYNAEYPNEPSAGDAAMEWIIGKADGFLSRGSV